MKKIISLVLLASVCLSMFAADIFTYAPIKGEVSAYKRTDYSIASRFGNYYRTPSVKFATLLDANGNEVESTEISAKEVLVNTIKSTYDSNNNLLSQVATDSEGAIIWTSEYKYKDNLLSEVSEYNSAKELKSKTIYTYSFNRLIDESSYSGDGALVWKIIYLYDKNDKLEKICNYFPTGALSEEAVYEYEEDGRIKSISHSDSVNKETLKEVFRYNGNVLNEITTYNEATDVTKRVLLKYDAAGNVIQISTYNVANKFGGIVSELAGMSDISYKYGLSTVSDDEEVIVISEK